MKICAYMHIVQLWRQTMQDLIKALKALSDETRLRIVKIVLKRECCVCEIIQALAISQSRASRNLRILEEAGFVKSKRDGTWIVYSVDWQTANKHTISLTKLLGDLPLRDKVLTQDKERLRHTTRTGPEYRQNR